MNRRQFILFCMMLTTVVGPLPAAAKDGGGDNSGSGGSGSGGGGSGSGGGQGRGRGRGGDDNDDDDDNEDDDDKDDKNQKDDAKLRKDVADKVKRGELASVAMVLKAALDHTPGKVLDVKLRRRFLSYVYRVKILDTSGRKRELHIQAKTLQIIKVS